MQFVVERCNTDNQYIVPLETIKNKFKGPNDLKIGILHFL